MRSVRSKLSVVAVSVLLVGACSGSGGSSEQQSPVSTSIYFGVMDDSHASYLWTTDGTDGGRPVVTDGSVSSPEALFAWGDVVLFGDSDQRSGSSSLWKTDGTAAGTVRLKTGVMPSQYVSVGPVVYFTSAMSLWRTDGTEAGTIRLKDGLSSTDLAVAGNTIYFGVWDTASGGQLWASDGTLEGTRAVLDASSRTFSPGHFFAWGNGVLFSDWYDDDPWEGGTSNVDRTSLWKSDGTVAGTVPLKAQLQPKRYVSAGAFVYFTAKDDGGTGRSLWRTDGTEVGTIRLKESVADFSLALVGNRVYFGVRDPGTSGPGQGLWVSDGTDEGTHPVFTSRSFSAEEVFAWGDVVLFKGYEGFEEPSLWKSDGTEAGTVPLKAGVSPVYYASAGSVVYFTAQNHGSACLWRTDGTEAGTVLVNDGLSGFDLAVSEH